MSAIKRKNSLSSADRGGIQNRPQIAVAVASWNDRAGLAACLDSILAEPENQGVEIVVARSATSDIALLEEDYPSVRFVRAEDHANPSDLRCAAMREASGDVVLFTDDAQPPRSDWIATVAARHQEASRKIASGTESDDHERWAEHFVSGDDESDSAGPRPRQVAQLVSGDRAVMIGAGPGGLTAGYLLAKGGVDVTVLEAEDVIGGISQTAKYKGYRFDIGGHRFFTKYPPVQELWEEILGEDFISVPRLSRIYYEGRLFDYPLKAMNALRGLGVLNACLIFLSYLKSHLWPSPVEETFEQWVSNRFGKRLYGIFFKTYTEKVWGIPCSEIRAEWAAQRIQGLSLAKAILSAASITRRSPTIKTLINEFQYPRLGPGQMWETCAQRVQDFGSKVHLRHRVEHVEVRDNRVVAVHVQTADGSKRIEGEHFFSTMPIRTLVHAITPTAPEHVRAAAAGLRYRDFLVVALIIDAADLFPDNWIYIHSRGVQVGRIQNFNNWSRAMVPDEGRTCIGMEYFCFEGDGLWDSKDEDLIALAKTELAELKLGDADLVVDGTVVRMPKAYPIYDAEYRGHLDKVQDYLDGISNLHPVGRNGMHKYNNQDHSMLTAMMSVWNMMGAQHDVWAVNTDFEYHEEMRLSDPPSVAGSRASTATSA